MTTPNQHETIGFSHNNTRNKVRLRASTVTSLTGRNTSLTKRNLTGPPAALQTTDDDYIQ